MVGDSFVARKHGIQYCQAGDPFVGENDCQCFKCENARLKSALQRLQERVGELERAIADEREACAKVADDWANGFEPGRRAHAEKIAQAIRARSLLSPTEVEK